MKRKRYFAALLTVSMLSAVPIQAEGWVRVSAWAYNDVSNFTNEGLLPECMEGVTDYLAPATLEQVCEILYSVRQRILPELDLVESSIYADSNNEVISEIIYYHDYEQIAQRVNIEYPSTDLTYEEKEQYVRESYSDVSIHKDQYGHYMLHINPNEPITRARVVTIYQSCYDFWMPYTDLEQFPEDVYYEGVTDRRSTFYAKLNGIMDASYEPSAYMTIEQAIVAAYRIYNKFPSTLLADSERIDGNGLIQIYSNGIEEYKQDNMLILKQNGTVLAEYETDVYKNIYCITLSDGRVIAAAQHFLGHTDVYSLADGSVITTVPHETDSVTEDYIITKSKQESGFTYGVSSYDGNTVFAPEYSMKEIKAIKDNGFVIPAEEYRAADGWVYFIEEDTRYLYRVDTNGENEQLLADRECYEVQVKDGYVFALLRTSSVYDTYELCRMKPDGSEVVQIAENAMFMTDSLGKTLGMQYYPDCGNWMYYWCYEEGEWHGIRMRTDTDKIVKENIFEGEKYILAMTEEHMYYQIPQDEERTKEKGTFYKNLNTNEDIKVSEEYWDNVEIKDGNVYFDVFESQDRGVPRAKECVAPLGSKEYIEIVREDSENENARLNGGVWKEGEKFYRTISKYTDKTYAVGYQATTSTKEYDDFNNRLEDWYYIDKATGESYKLNLGANSMVKIRARTGNNLYITLSEKMIMLIYDMDKHEIINTIDRVEGAEWENKGEYYYTDTGNLMRLDFSDLSYKHVYPSKGIYRYSKAASIALIRGEICKIDENGFYLRLSEHKAEQALYMEN